MSEYVQVKEMVPFESCQNLVQSQPDSRDTVSLEDTEKDWTLNSDMLKS